MKEVNIDAMKYRKNTHIAGADVQMERGVEDKPFIVTIKEAYYQTKVNVSGNRTDGYFLEFEEEGVKPMVVNSTNRKTIAFILQEGFGYSSLDSRNIGNWKGLKIELTFDESVTMMGKKTGGIRVSPKIFKKHELTEKSEKWDSAKKAVSNGTDRATIEKHYVITDENWKKLNQKTKTDEKK